MSAWNSRSTSPVSTTCASIPPTRSWQCHVGFSSLLCEDGNQEGIRRDACVPQCHSHHATASVCVPRDVCHFATLCADPTPEKFVKPLQIDSSIDAIANSTTRACAVRAGVVQSGRPGACMPPRTFPSALCGLLVQKPVCNAMADNRLCTSSLLDCAVKAKEPSSRFPHVDPECPVCVGCRVFSQHVESRFRFLKTAVHCLQKIHSLVPLLQAVCNRSQVPSDPRTCRRCPSF